MNQYIHYYSMPDDKWKMNFNEGTTVVECDISVIFGDSVNNCWRHETKRKLIGGCACLFLCKQVQWLAKTNVGREKCRKVYKVNNGSGE